ncbi:MAG: BamA/TamA family outer membrane protein, partial [Planctomycetia bacterium]|nr:BamA/TamA family outer membrane protein [Planctomycetia bacterium]
MTRGVQVIPTGPGTAAPGRAADGARALPSGETSAAPTPSPLACRLALAALALTLALAPAPPARAARGGDELPDGVISQIKVEGNVSVTSEKVRGKVLSRVGGRLDARTINADIASLNASKWFTAVEAFHERDPSDPTGRSYILIFAVKESPVLTHVEFRGLKSLKLKEIQELTGLKVGNRADATRTHLAVGQIQRLYEEKGYELAEVKLLEGGGLGDTRVVIGIFEGEKFHIGSVDFEGNAFATDSVLRTKVGSKSRVLGFIGGKYHRDNLEEDRRKLVDYYTSQGFLEVAVTPTTRTGSTLGDVRLTFVVSEGKRYRVRNIAFQGNKKIHADKLKDGMVMHSGMPILETVKDADRKSLIAKYHTLGCIDTMILADIRYTDEPGVVDIVYKIEEGDPYLLGEMKVEGNERTKTKVLLREAARAGLLPGEPLDLTRIEKYKMMVGGTQVFNMAQDQGKGFNTKVVNRRPHDKPYGDVPLGDLNGVLQTRMQGPDPGPAPTVEVPRAAQAPEAIPGASSVPGPSPAPGAGAPFGAVNNPFDPSPDTPPIPVPIPAAPPAGASPPGRPRGPSANPIGAGEPPGTIPNIPGLNANDVGPDRQDPFPGRSWADIITSVEEAPTGRFMLGVGASSYQGVSGNLTISEKNFDITNIPRSWNDVVSGNAFRGAQQQFTMNLMPGTLINRFDVSLKEPYLFNKNIGASAAGYLFQRIYPNWTEGRAGGRFSLGRQFGTQTYADVAVRAEEVNFYGYRSPAPADYLAASGHTFLSTIRPSIRFDNRNAPLSPNKGQYLELSFEQGFGTFTYPKAEVEGRSYFTVWNRPDGSGKQILTLRGHLGATGRDTPVYERFFAGNFGSLRGFQYRGVG